MRELTIRPHHGMCLAFFQGKGYSGGFTAHMAQVKESLEQDPAVRLVVGGDEICTCCPNLRGGVCTAADKVERYDRAVLAACGLEDGAVLPWRRFAQLVDGRILAPGRRQEICGDCQWDTLCAQDNGNFMDHRGAPR